jgi:hypothetical protein
MGMIVDSVSRTGNMATTSGGGDPCLGLVSPRHNLSVTTIAQNEATKRISGWAAIFAIPTMIAGVYGMNFEFMPELRWRWGYPVVMAVPVGLLRDALLPLHALRLALSRAEPAGLSRCGRPGSPPPAPARWGPRAWPGGG